MRRLLHALWLLLLACAGLKAGADLARMILFEFKGSLNGDSLIYLTMGRGILNGLRPYVDLFESKPPGLFYLFAVSTALTGGPGPLRVFESASLLCLPAACVFAAWRLGGRRDSVAVAAVLGAFLFGGLLALRAQEAAGGLQSEMFGVVPAVLYVLSATVFADRRSWAWTLLRAACVFAAVAVREPYALGLLAVALLAARTMRDVWELFALPALLAAGAALVLLLTAGLLQSYVEVYLPGMLGDRVTGGKNEPLAWKLLWVHRLFGSWAYFSTIPILGYLAGPLWLLAVVGRDRPRRLVLPVVTAVGGVLLIHELFVLAVLLTKTASAGLSPARVLADPSFVPITAAYGAGITVLAGLFALLARGRPHVAFRVLCGLVALLSLDLSAGIGGYVWNYLLYSLPAVLCLFLLFLKSARPSWAIAAVTAGLAVAVLAYHQTDGQKNNQVPHLLAETRSLSAALDRVLDACGEGRFAYDGLFPYFALSRHSPVGPMFTPYFHEYLGLDHPLYRRTFENIAAADVLVIPTWVANPKVVNPVPKSILDSFTAPRPACAASLPDPHGYAVRFRRRQT